MGRPTKEGLDYFPLDVDFFEDEKLRIVRTQHGPVADLVLIRLLCRIYRSGYYYDWNKAHQILLAGEVGQPLEFVQAVVASAVEWEFFSAELLSKHGILTSAGIQRRFVEATKKRREPSIRAEYTITGVLSAPETPNLGVSAGINPQSRVEESRVEESRVKNNSAAEAALVSASPDVFLEFPHLAPARQDWEQFLDYRRKIRKPLKPASFKAQLSKWTRAEDLAAACKVSIANGWQGLFPAKNNTPATGQSKAARNVQATVDCVNRILREEAELEQN